MGRNHLIGLDKPTRASVRGQANLETSLRRQARGHELNRLESIAEVLVLLGVLAVREIFSGHESVRTERAYFQFGKGVRADSTEAAHCLPGHLHFNSTPLRNLGAWKESTLAIHGIKPLPLDSKLRNLAARTDVVDRWVNGADSALEIMANGFGLKHAYGGAVERLLRRTLNHPFPDWMVLLREIMCQYDWYRNDAKVACKSRIEFYRQKASASNSSGSTAEDCKRMIVESFEVALRDERFQPEAFTKNGFETLLKDVLRTEVIAGGPRYSESA